MYHQLFPPMVPPTGEVRTPAPPPQPGAGIVSPGVPTNRQQELDQIT